MTKEETLECLKSCILLIAQDQIPAKKQEFNDLKQKVDEGIQSLSSNDTMWMNKEYGKWFKSNQIIQSRMKEVFASFPEVSSKS